MDYGQSIKQTYKNGSDIRSFRDDIFHTRTASIFVWTRKRFPVKNDWFSLVLNLYHNLYIFFHFSEDQLLSVAERTILEADVDGDGMISFEEFCSVLDRSQVEHKMSIKFLN